MPDIWMVLPLNTHNQVLIDPMNNLIVVSNQIVLSILIVRKIRYVLPLLTAPISKGIGLYHRLVGRFPLPFKKELRSYYLQPLPR